MVRQGVILAVALVVLGVLAPARPAIAQQGGPPGYPGPTTTVPSGPTSEEQNAGTVRAGQTIVVESCGFEPDDQRVSVTWNGQEVGTAPVGDDGCARVEVEVHGRDAEPNPCPAARVNDREVGGTRGRNDLVVVGEGTNGHPRTVTSRVVISCSNGSGRSGPSSETQQEGGPSADDELAGDPGVRASDTGSSQPGAMSTISHSTPVRWGSLGLVLAVVGLSVLFGERLRRTRRATL